MGQQMRFGRIKKKLICLTGSRHFKNSVTDQVRTLSQVGTKKILQGGWAILELLSHLETMTSFSEVVWLV